MANEAGPTGDCSTFSVILVEKLFLIISSQFIVLKNALPLASCKPFNRYFTNVESQIFTKVESVAKYRP